MKNNSHFTPERLPEHDKLESRRNTVTAAAGDFKVIIYSAFESQWPATEPTAQTAPLTGTSGIINASVESAQTQQVQELRQRVEEAHNESVA